MRIAVCDNDEQEVSCIRELVTEYQISRKESIDCRYFTNSTDFLYELKGGEYDLVLMDVQMPGEGGIETAREMRELDKNVRLILVSSSPEFAVDSYRVGAYYYLLKPIEADSFFALLDKIGGELSAQVGQGFVVKSKAGVVRITFAWIVYVEVINKTVFFYLADGTVCQMTAALADFEKKLLLRPEFLKTHRSYLVNLNYVQAIDTKSVRMKNGDRVPVSRQRRSQVQDAYVNFLNRPGTEDPAPTEGSVKRPDGPWRILLVDDDPADCTVWPDILRSHGCIVYVANNGEEALRLAAENYCDCVLLDVMISGEDGFSICEKLHGLMDTPIIFLSNLTESDKQLEGFAVGGIDYITKDTPADLFWAKVETRVRMARSELTQLQYGPLLLDLTRRKVMIDEKELPFTSIEFDILCRLSESTGHIFTPEEIYGMIWGSQPWDGGKLVQMHMSRIRRKLEKAWEGHRFIETVWGQGYRFVPGKPRQE